MMEETKPNKKQGKAARMKEARLLYRGIVYTVFQDSRKSDKVISCILLSEAGEPIARGWALGSYSEGPNNRKGRRIARGRAIKALIENADSNTILRQEAHDVLTACGLLILFGAPKVEVWEETSRIFELEQANITSFLEKKQTLLQSLTQAV
jgi:hypothetical protein